MEGTEGKTFPMEGRRVEVDELLLDVEFVRTLNDFLVTSALGRRYIGPLNDSTVIQVVKTSQNK